MVPGNQSKEVFDMGYVDFSVYWNPYVGTFFLVWTFKIIEFFVTFRNWSKFCSQTIFFGAIFFKPQVLVVKRSFLGFLRVESHEGGLGEGILEPSTPKYHQFHNAINVVFWGGWSKYTLPQTPLVTFDPQTPQK